MLKKNIILLKRKKERTKMSKLKNHYDNDVYVSKDVNNIKCATCIYKDVCHPLKNAWNCKDYKEVANG